MKMVLAALLGAPTQAASAQDAMMAKAVAGWRQQYASAQSFRTTLTVEETRNLNAPVRRAEPADLPADNRSEAARVGLPVRVRTTYSFARTGDRERLHRVGEGMSERGLIAIDTLEVLNGREARRLFSGAANLKPYDQVDFLTSKRGLGIHQLVPLRLVVVDPKNWTT